MTRKVASAYLNLGRDRLLSQEWLNRELSDKALKMAGYSGLIMGFGLTIIRLSDLGIFEQCLFVAQSILFISIGFLAFRITSTRSWSPAPEMEAVSRSLGKPEEIIESMGDGYSKSVESNKETLLERSRLLRYAGRLAFTQTLLLSIIAGLSIF